MGCGLHRPHRNEVRAARTNVRPEAIFVARKQHRKFRQRAFWDFDQAVAVNVGVEVLKEKDAADPAFWALLEPRPAKVAVHPEEQVTNLFARMGEAHSAVKVQRQADIEILSPEPACKLIAIPLQDSPVKIRVG